MRCTISCILLAAVYWSRDEMEIDDKSFFAGDIPIRLLYASFNGGRLHLVRDVAAEKEVDIAI